jgi:hypothetical protein
MTHEQQLNTAAGFKRSSFIFHHCHTYTLSLHTMAANQRTTKATSGEEEKKKLLQQYKNDDGHFSLVR